MNEQDAGTLSTLTTKERLVIAHALTLTATMLDALGDVREARETLDLWERVSPDFGV